MTNNLKIEVLVSNIPEDGSIASQFPSQEYVNQQLTKKANLSPEGRLDPSQAPDYTEIPGLYEHIEDTKDEIGSSITSSLQDAKGYTNQKLSEGLRTKADLVNGKIPFDQIPFSADIEDRIQINVENITAVVDQKVAQVVEQVNEVATAANTYTDTKVGENKAYIDRTIGNVIEDVSKIGVSKALTIPTYLTPEAGVATGTGVAAGAYYNVRSTEDDTVTVEYQNVAGVATSTGKRYLSPAGVASQEKLASTIKDTSGKTQQAINDNQRALFANILDYGAKPFMDGNPNNAFNNYQVISAAISDLEEGGTLYIPAGNWACGTSKVYITDKNINIICDGKIYIDSTTPSCGFGFRQTPIVKSGLLLNTAPKRGATKLDVNSSDLALPKSLGNYFLNIRSTETHLMAVLTGGEQPYLKLQTIDFVHNDFTMRLPNLYDYNDKSSITLNFFEKKSAVDVELNIVLYNVNASTNITNVIQTDGAFGINWKKYSIKIHENIENINGTGFAAVQSMFMRFGYADCSIFSKGGGGSSYNFLNSMSSFLSFDYIVSGYGSGSKNHWYVARHGRMIKFGAHCCIGIDDHYGHDYYINESILPAGVTFTGGNITFNNVTGPKDGFLLNFRSDAPLAQGRCVFNNCNVEYGFLFVDGGQTSYSESFRNTFHPFDEIIINGGSCRLSDKNPCIIFNPLDPRYILKPIDKIEINNLRVVVPDGYTNGPYGTFINGVTATDYKVARKLVFNNVDYEIEGSQTTAANVGNIFLRRFVADEIQFNNCTGFNYVGCRANKLTVRGGSFGTPANGKFGSNETDIRQLDNAAVIIRIQETIFSPLAILQSAAADYTTVQKRYYITDSEINSALMGTTSEANFVRKATGNYAGEGINSGWISFDYKNYISDVIRGERYSRVSMNIPSLSPGSASSVQTATLKNARLNQNEQVVGSLNVDSKGLRVVPWVSAADVVSFYIENPTGNPNGTVILGNVNILLKTI